MPASKDFIRALEKVFRIKGEVDRIMQLPTSASIALKTRSDGQLSATNEQLNQLRALGTKWNNELTKMALRDENWWVDWSGTNAFSAIESRRALTRIRDLRQRLANLKEGCKGLSALAYTVLVADNMDIKSWGKAYVPSLVIIDAHVAKEASTRFKACSAHAGKVIVNLDRILPELDKTYRMAMGLEKAVRKQTR